MDHFCVYFCSELQNFWKHLQQIECHFHKSANAQEHNLQADDVTDGKLSRQWLMAVISCLVSYEKPSIWMACLQLVSKVNAWEDIFKTSYDPSLDSLMVKSNVMRANDVEPMLAEDIPSHPNPVWQFCWYLLFYWLTSPKILWCWFRPTVKSTNDIFSYYPCRFLPPLPLSLSLPNPLSLCLSFSPFCPIARYVLPVLISLK